MRCEKVANARWVVASVPAELPREMSSPQSAQGGKQSCAMTQLPGLYQALLSPVGQPSLGAPGHVPQYWSLRATRTLGWKLLVLWPWTRPSSQGRWAQAMVLAQLLARFFFLFPLVYLFIYLFIYNNYIQLGAQTHDPEILLARFCIGGSGVLRGPRQPHHREPTGGRQPPGSQRPGAHSSFLQSRGVQETPWD